MWRGGNGRQLRGYEVFGTHMSSPLPHQQRSVQTDHLPQSHQLTRAMSSNSGLMYARSALPASNTAMALRRLWGIWSGASSPALMAAPPLSACVSALVSYSQGTCMGHTIMAHHLAKDKDHCRPFPPLLVCLCACYQGAG